MFPNGNLSHQPPLFSRKFPFGNMDIVDTQALNTAIHATRERLKVTKKDLAPASGNGLRFILEWTGGRRHRRTKTTPGPGD